MGRCLVLTSSWTDDFIKVIEKEKIDVLRLSDSAGWSGDDLSFLEHTPTLRGIEIYSWNIKDITPISHLNKLEYIGLQCEFSKAPDFNEFESLKICKLLWRPKAKSVLNCSKLTLLNISNYPFENLQSISEMKQLQRLQLTSKKLVSLEGIESLEKLEILDIANSSKLSSLEGVDKCTHLKNVEFESCKNVSDISLLGTLEELRKLHIIDCAKLGSLSTLASCSNLEELYFTGSTNVEDGDLNIVDELPNLKKMWFADKRHYSHKRDEIKVQLEQR